MIYDDLFSYNCHRKLDIYLLLYRVLQTERLHQGNFRGKKKRANKPINKQQSQ